MSRTRPSPLARELYAADAEGTRDAARLASRRNERVRATRLPPAEVPVAERIAHAKSLLARASLNCGAALDSDDAEALTWIDDAREAAREALTMLEAL